MTLALVASKQISFFALPIMTIIITAIILDVNPFIMKTQFISIISLESIGCQSNMIFAFEDLHFIVLC
jgi:hypothetical protein